MYSTRARLQAAGTRRCRAFALAAFGLASLDAHAIDGFGIGAGPTAEIDKERTAVATVSWLSPGRHPWELSAGYLGRRDELENAPAPSSVFIAVSKRLTWRRWFVSGGVAANDHDGEVLSGHWQFYTGLGYTVGAWSLSVRHLSNGDTGGRNRGESFALLEHRW